MKKVRSALGYAELGEFKQFRKSPSSSQEILSVIEQMEFTKPGPTNLMNDEEVLTLALHAEYSDRGGNGYDRDIMSGECQRFMQGKAQYLANEADSNSMHTDNSNSISNSNSNNINSSSNSISSSSKTIQRLTNAKASAAFLKNFNGRLTNILPPNFESDDPNELDRINKPKFSKNSSLSVKRSSAASVSIDKA